MSNIYECWDRGIGTIMILGDICTEMVSAKTGKPVWDDPMEPFPLHSRKKWIKTRSNYLLIEMILKVMAQVFGQRQSTNS